MGVADDGLGVIQPAFVLEVVRPRMTKAGRAQKRISAEAVELFDSGEYAALSAWSGETFSTDHELPGGIPGSLCTGPPGSCQAGSQRQPLLSLQTIVSPSPARPVAP